MMKLSTTWTDSKNQHLLGWFTQKWAKLARYHSNLRTEAWLDGPIGQPRKIDDDFFEDIARYDGLYIDSATSSPGLMENFLHLNSAKFEGSCVHPKIIDFYERTSCYEFDIWCEWVPFVKPFAKLFSILFSKRLQQLNLPLSSIDFAHGLTSEIVCFRNQSTQTRRYAGWLRKFRKTGDVLFAGAYMSCVPPNLDNACVKAVFPLPYGNVTVILWPENTEDGSFKLHSAGDRYGDCGLYLLMNFRHKDLFVKYVKSIKQIIHVYLDEQDVIRTDHFFKFWGITFLQLHYRIRSKNKSNV